MSFEEEDLEHARRYRVHDMSLLTLHVLVQNRHKDGNSVLVLGGHGQLLSAHNDDVMRGKAEMEQVHTFQPEELATANSKSVAP